jgi:hypothetical protein
MTHSNHQTYTALQQQYVDSVDGSAHQSAIEIIGALEEALAELVNEPQPLGIDRPTYQRALKLMGDGQ